MLKPRRLAVLIDMDPLEPRLLGRILAKAADYGAIGIRRAYGNCAKLSDWEACLQYRGIKIARNYGSGANAADITLIIDAVDMLRAGKADGFCIVASDHHYTGLIKWLRDRKVPVAGIGRRAASPDLREAYGGSFTAVEDLASEAKVPDGPCWDAERGLIDRIKTAINCSRKPREKYVRLSRVRDRLGNFEARAYCHRDLVSLLKWYDQEFRVKDGLDIGRRAGDYVRIWPSSGQAACPQHRTSWRVLRTTCTCRGQDPTRSH